MRERRDNFRVEWNSSAKIYDHDGRLIEQCVVRNFSNSGARIIGVEFEQSRTSLFSAFRLTAVSTNAASFGVPRTA